MYVYVCICVVLCHVYTMFNIMSILTVMYALMRMVYYNVRDKSLIYISYALLSMYTYLLFYALIISYMYTIYRQYASFNLNY